MHAREEILELPDYEYLIKIANEIHAEKDIPPHNWSFCGTCKSAFYNEELYITHFETSPDCIATLNK